MYDKAYHKAYAASRKGKERRKLYRQSLKGKAAQAKQNQRAKTRRNAWSASLKGRITKNKYQNWWFTTPKGQASRKRNAARRRALEFAENGSFTIQEWLNLLAVYDNRCLGCGLSANDLRIIGRIIVPDHVVPLAYKSTLLLGKRNTIQNIQPLCHGFQGCNNKKSAKLIDYRQPLR
jgi:hypothetical protein